MACEVSIDVVDQLLCSLQSSAVPTSLECVSSGLRGLFGLRSSIVGTWDLEFEAFCMWVSTGLRFGRSIG